MAERPPLAEPFSETDPPPYTRTPERLSRGMPPPPDETPLAIDRQWDENRRYERNLIMASCVVAVLACFTAATLAMIAFSLIRTGG